MRLIATAHGIVPAAAAAPNPARRSWLKRLGAVLGGAALARPALAGPTQVTGQEPYLGEIMLVGWNFATQGWMICDGTLLPISQYQALFQLLGTTYGGNGTTTFALPDLRGRAPKHTGQGTGLSNYARGVQGGGEGLTLITSIMPTHSHTVNASTGPATSSSPIGAVPAVPSGTDVNGETVPVLAYTGPSTGTEAAGALANTGSSQAINLRSGQLAMNYQIAVQGIYPTPQ
jgi:microcystin-dependent protein